MLGSRRDLVQGLSEFPGAEGGLSEVRPLGSSSAADPRAVRLPPHQTANLRDLHFSSLLNRLSGPQTEAELSQATEPEGAPTGREAQGYTALGQPYVALWLQAEPRPPGRAHPHT
ncbi:hypothetical protein AAFF_G00424780 [Aldrovandia affinis]|uniref:Uncharacterized protein n=1 Tax=Aldrovandia affinis TaxID=143900 RepID=A0AAD7X0A5_9TELE|nr:hypothetical protein AAFF_G00424780 [Aldrovandia affinis]